ncbi:MAG: hypothetical protein LUC31_00085 [Coprobacillus sp.]|nr:hypothetical protein [Coprobacillus sp.]
MTNQIILGLACTLSLIAPLAVVGPSEDLVIELEPIDHVTTNSGSQSLSINVKTTNGTQSLRIYARPTSEKNNGNKLSNIDNADFGTYEFTTTTRYLDSNKVDLGAMCAQSSTAYFQFYSEEAKVTNPTSEALFQTLPFGGTAQYDTYTVTEPEEVKVSGHSIATDYEYYDFTNSKFFVTEDGGYMDTNFTFSYKTWYSEGFSKNTHVWMEIKDPYDAFSQITSKDSDGVFTIPCQVSSSFNSSSGRGSVSIIPVLDGFYVNPYTLEMSDKQMINYISADRFYFANKSNDLFSECEYTIYMEDCMGNGAAFAISLEYTSTLSYFGRCNSSSYCIIGGRYA